MSFPHDCAESPWPGDGVNDRPPPGGQARLLSRDPPKVGPSPPARRLVLRLVLVALASALVSLAVSPFVARFVGVPLDGRQILLAIAIPVIVAPLVAFRTHKLSMQLLAERARVRELTGLLPICAWCRKIRDDAGYWQSIERFVARHSRAELTHSMCPDCLGRQFPEGEPEPP